ncbi:MAB_1171c family putative transporter [Sphaerisporangium sp. NPDC004334]
MPNALESFILLLLLGATLWRTPSALQTAGHRGVWLTFLGLLVAKTFAVPIVIEAVNSLAGGWQVASVVKRVAGLIAISGVLMFVDTISTAEDQEAARRRRERRRTWTLVLAAVLLVALWAVQGRDAVAEFADLRGHATAARAYFATFEGVLAFAGVELAMMCFRYRGQVRPSAFRTGISLVGLAAVMSLLNGAYNFTYLTATIISPDRWDGTYSLILARWILAPCIMLLTIGMSISAVAAWVQRVRDYRAYIALEPLWRAIAGRFPDIVLPSPGANTYQRLYNRVIEISDGLLRLSEYESPATLVRARAAARAAGVREDQGEDVAEACWIAAALRTSEGGEVLPEDAERVQLRGEAIPARQIALLIAVSRAFISSPLVSRVPTMAEDQPQ